jgi:hypothetical protein
MKTTTGDRIDPVNSCNQDEEFQDYSRLYADLSDPYHMMFTIATVCKIT